MIKVMKLLPEAIGAAYPSYQERREAEENNKRFQEQIRNIMYSKSRSLNGTVSMIYHKDLLKEMLEIDKYEKQSKADISDEELDRQSKEERSDKREFDANKLIDYIMKQNHDRTTK